MKKGDTVIFNGYCIEQVRWGGNDTPDMLTINNTYVIESVEKHRNHTKVSIAGYPGLKFNSVHFTLTQP